VDTVAKKDIVAELNTKTGLPVPQGEKLVDAIIGVIKEQLLTGRQVLLSDFAAMKIVEKKAQIVKDPETGHQFISPAENVVEFVPIDSFQKSIEGAKLSSIILAVPGDDPFARVIEFHFSRVGWRVHIANTPDECVDMITSAGAYLCIVDSGLDGSEDLIRRIKSERATSLIPLITLYPSENDPESSKDFLILGDEFLVEPFEVYNLLMMAESELARSSEEEIIFDQQVNFQFGSTEAFADRALELAESLFKASGLHQDGIVALKAAFREAVGNAMVHGNGEDSSKLVKVLYLLDREKITCVIQDDGTGFQHKNYVVDVSSKAAEEAARKRQQEGGLGGLGILLMLKCTDRLEYNDVGNMLTLTKYLKPKN